MHVLIGYGAVSLGFAGALLGAGTSVYSLITKRPELMKAVRLHVGLIAVAVVVAFVTGVLLDGELAVPQTNSPLSWFFSIGCVGNGVLYFVRLLWVNGLDGLFSSSFPYGLQGGGNPVAAGFFYGKTFLYTAGLMNLLVVLDVHDIARGDKS